MPEAEGHWLTPSSQLKRLIFTLPAANSRSMSLVVLPVCENWTWAIGGKKGLGKGRTQSAALNLPDSSHRKRKNLTKEITSTLRTLLEKPEREKVFKSIPEKWVRTKSRGKAIRESNQRLLEMLQHIVSMAWWSAKPDGPLFSFICLLKVDLKSGRQLISHFQLRLIASSLELQWSWLSDHKVVSYSLLLERMCY